MATATISARPARPSARPAGRSAVRPAAPLRLTARGRRLVRAVAVLALVVLAFVGFVLGQGAVSVAGTEPTGPATTQVVVQPGQTLWSIASAALPEADSREAVARVAELNNLAPSAQLAPGQPLVLPLSS